MDVITFERVETFTGKIETFESWCPIILTFLRNSLGQSKKLYPFDSGFFIDPKRVITSIRKCNL